MPAAAGEDWKGDPAMTIEQNTRAIVDHELRAAVALHRDLLRRPWRDIVAEFAGGG